MSRLLYTLSLVNLTSEEIECVLSWAGSEARKPDALAAAWIINSAALKQSRSGPVERVARPVLADRKRCEEKGRIMHEHTVFKKHRPMHVADFLVLWDRGGGPAGFLKGAGVADTPSARRAASNVAATLRRLGFTVAKAKRGPKRGSITAPPTEEPCPASST